MIAETLAVDRIIVRQLISSNSIMKFITPRV